MCVFFFWFLSVSSSSKRLGYSFEMETETICYIHTLFPELKLYKSINLKR